MKRTYTKPTLYAEKFELMEHISSCTANTEVTTVTYRDPGSCAYNDMNVHLFNDGVSGCLNEYYDSAVMTWTEYLESFKPENGGGCYNSFADGNFFAS